MSADLQVLVEDPVEAEFPEEENQGVCHKEDAQEATGYNHEFYGHRNDHENKYPPHDALKPVAKSIPQIEVLLGEQDIGEYPRQVSLQQV